MCEQSLRGRAGVYDRRVGASTLSFALAECRKGSEVDLEASTTSYIWEKRHNSIVSKNKSRAQRPEFCIKQDYVQIVILL
jgi:hypothetical protein